MKDSDSFISLVTKSHIFGPRWDTNSVPCQTEFTALLLNGFLSRRSYGLALGAKSYFIISSAILFLILNISVARACIFLKWIETELPFFNRSWIEDDFSPYVNINALLCKAFILLLRLLLWNIQIKVTNAIITVFLFSRYMDGTTLANALSFWIAFLQRLFISSK